MLLEKNYIDAIQEIDPDFKVYNFKIYCEDILHIVQDAWSKKEKDILKRYECKELYELHALQLDTMAAQNIRNVTKDMTISNVIITDFKIANNEELITVIMPVSLVDYYEEIIPNSKDGYIKQGNSTTKVNAQYTLIFSRPKNFQSNSLLTDKTEICPNCSAPITIQEQDYCEYCDSPLPTMHSVYKIKSLSI